MWLIEENLYRLIKRKFILTVYIFLLHSQHRRSADWFSPRRSKLPLERIKTHVSIISTLVKTRKCALDPPQTCNIAQIHIEEKIIGTIEIRTNAYESYRYRYSYNLEISTIIKLITISKVR